jgi:hypothetical protein
MEKKKGLVLKKHSRSCIVLTPEGEFCKIPMPGKTVQLGEEVIINPVNKLFEYRKIFLVAASILLVLCAVPAYRGLFPLTPAAAAYVSLDINPSVEFAVDSGQKIIKASGLNTEGEELLHRIETVNLDIYKGIELVITEAVKSNYLESSKENIVLSAVAPAQDAKSPVSEQNVYNAINKTLKATDIQTEVLVRTADQDTELKAKKAGVSTGKYLLYVQAQKKGVPISITELKKSNINQLQNDKNIKIRELIPKRVSEQKRSEHTNAYQNFNNKTDKTDKTDKTNKFSQTNKARSQNKPGAFQPVKTLNGISKSADNKTTTKNDITQQQRVKKQKDNMHPVRKTDKQQIKTNNSVKSSIPRGNADKNNHKYWGK